MTPSLVFWHCAGDVLCAPNLALSAPDTAALRGLYLDEASAAAASGDQMARTAALNLARQLSDAASAASQWRQASRAYPRAG